MDSNGSDDDDDTSPSSSPRTALRFNVSPFSFKKKMSFRTFRDSKRGGYTVNGPKLLSDSPYEGVPTTSLQFIETMPELALREMRTSVVLKNERSIDEDLPPPPSPPSPPLPPCPPPIDAPLPWEELQDRLNQSEDDLPPPYEVDEIEEQFPLEWDHFFFFLNLIVCRLNRTWS